MNPRSHESFFIKLFIRINVVFHGDDQPWASIDFHFSDQMYLEGSNKVCYDKLVFKYKDSNNDEAEVETMELCGNREPFDLTIPTTEVNVTFVSDYSMAKRGFYAKFNVVYNEKCYRVTELKYKIGKILHFFT